MLALAVGGLLVAGLVGWALTRTVEPAPATTVATTDTFPTASTTAATPPATPTTSQPAVGDGNVTATQVPPGATPGAVPPVVPTTSQPPAALPSHEERTHAPRIAVEDLREKKDAGTVTIIDVRDATSYAAGHIPGSINIPFASVQSQLDRIPKGKEIVTYCT